MFSAAEIVDILTETTCDPRVAMCVTLQYRPYLLNKQWRWFWVLLPDDGEAALATGEADTRSLASIQARQEARRKRVKITRVEMVNLPGGEQAGGAVD